MELLSRFSKKEEPINTSKFDLKGEIHKLLLSVITLEGATEVNEHLDSKAKELTDVIVSKYTSSFNESIPEQYDNYLRIPNRINVTADYCKKNKVTKEQFLEAVKLAGKVPSSIIYDNTSYFNSLQIHLQKIVNSNNNMEQSNIFS